MYYFVTLGVGLFLSPQSYLEEHPLLCVEFETVAYPSRIRKIHCGRQQCMLPWSNPGTLR